MGRCGGGGYALDVLREPVGLGGMEGDVDGWKLEEKGHPRPEGVDDWYVGTEGELVGLE